MQRDLGKKLRKTIPSQLSKCDRVFRFVSASLKEKVTPKTVYFLSTLIKTLILH